jgi:hypothetical protein
VKSLPESFLQRRTESPPFGVAACRRVPITRNWLLPVALLVLGGCASPLSPLETAVENRVTTPAKPAVTLRIAAVGDMMLGTDFPQNHLPDGDGFGLLSAMAPVLREADITFGNLEGTLLRGGEPAKRCQDPDRCYLFRSPPEYARALRAAGFDVVSLANNHARDFGEAGRSASMAALRDAGIRHSGREGDVASWEVKGRRVALIAFAPFKNSHDMLDIPRARARIAALAANHDVVLVSMHAGAEGVHATRIPFGNEFYYGEDRGDVVAFAHAAIEAGADLVLGHGPHVPRGLELYQGRLIAYSLGNFSTYYGISVEGLKGLAPVLKVELGPDGAFRKGQIISARQLRPAGPQPDERHAAARLMRTLSQQDFPANELIIDADGHLRRIPGTLSSTDPPAGSFGR